MRTFPFKKLDAFTAGQASGNPAGCVYLGEDAVISPDGMQQIARELKGYVNEVGFLRPVGDGFTLKYYSSECEVEFCGHATIAIMYDLLKENEQLRGKQELQLRVGADVLAVVNRIPEEDAVYIMAPPPRFPACALEPEKIAAALALNPGSLEAGLPVKLINAGLRTLIVPLGSLAGCLEALPDQETLRLFCLQNEIDIVLVFCRETSLSESHYRTRVFAPKYGYLEDPATGSGNAAFGHYLLQLGLWETGSLAVEQGPSRHCPSTVKLRWTSEDRTKRVLFGGGAVLRISGQYFLHS